MSNSEPDSAATSSPASFLFSLPSPASVKLPIRDKLFYFHSVVFQAEDFLFKVPRYGLPGDTAIFDTMFANATGGAGSSDDNPILLDADVSAQDFRSLLKAMIPPPGTSAVSLTLDEWMGVLTLANKWDLESMKDKAIDGSNAEVQKKSDVDKILLAKKYGVGKWLMQGYRALVSRKNLITPQEGEVLGWETYARIMYARAQGRAKAVDNAFMSLHTKDVVNCNPCGSQHFPLCTMNEAGPLNAMGLRQCANRCGVYHHVECAAGQMTKRSLMKKLEVFDYSSILEEVFGESLKL